MKTLEENDELSLLEPQSIKNDQTVKDLTKSFNPVLSRFYDHLHDGLFLYRINDLSSDQLDHLAVQWQPLVWRDTWPIEVKRSVIATMIIEKRRMGTRGAVRNTLASFGAASKFKEWWEKTPQGTPHTFEITVNQNELEGTVRSEVTTDLIRTIDLVKPVRSQYTLTIVQTNTGRLLLHTAAAALSMVRVGLNQTLNCNGKALTMFNTRGIALTISRI